MGVDLSKVKIGVLGGGVSSEREISLISAKDTCKALERKGIARVFIDISTSGKEEVKKILSSYDIDLAFIALHGEFGEDGKLQSILDEMGIPYTGSDPYASYRAMDKIVSKEIFLEKGIPTASFCVCSKGDRLSKDLRYPLVVKPYFCGSTLGISIVRGANILKRAMDEAFSYQNKIILEDYIEGRELTVGILEEKPLAVVEIIPQSGYYDFHAKYTDGAAEFIVPARLEKKIYKGIQEVALKAHLSLGCRHFSRVDLRLNKDNLPFVLEVNSIPGLTTHSLLPMCAKVCGIDFDDLILKMVSLALNEKKKEQTQRV